MPLGSCSCSSTSCIMKGDNTSFHLFHELGTAPIFSWTPTHPICSTCIISSHEQSIQQLELETRTHEEATPHHALQHETATLIACPPNLQDGSTTSIPSADMGSLLLEKPHLSSSHVDDQKEQLEEYIHELVPALHMVSKSTHVSAMQDIYQRQEAFKLTADAVLARRATGMAWSDALSERVRGKAWSDALISERTLLDHSGQVGIMNEASFAAQAEGEVHELWKSDLECASSSCIGTPVPSDHGTSSSYCELSTASLGSSDHSSMVDSTSNEPMQDDVLDGAPALNHAQSGVTCPAMVALSSSLPSSHHRSDSNAELLTSNSSMHANTHNDQENPILETEKLYEEINARILMIRGCCKEWKEDDAGGRLAGAMETSEVALSESLGSWMNGGGAGTELGSMLIRSGEEGIHAAATSSDQINGAGIHEAGVHDQSMQLVAHQQRHKALFDLQDGLACKALADMAPRRQLPYAEVAVAGHEDERLHPDVMTYCSGAHVQLPVQHALQYVDMAGRLYDVAGQNVLVKNADEDAEMAGKLEVAHELERQLSDVDPRRGSHRENKNTNVREMMYRVAAYKPIDWGSIMEEVVGKERPRRKNVRISEEPQSVAARRRRERISDRIRILQRLVPGANKLDTASMLDEAIHYLKFLKLQVQALRRLDKLYAFPAYMNSFGAPLHPPPPPPPLATINPPSSSSSSSSSSSTSPFPPLSYSPSPVKI